MYTVVGYAEYRTSMGTIEEEAIKLIDAKTSSQAKKIAKQLFKEGKYSSIYISYSHRDSSCYLNPIIGHEPVGKNWVSFLDLEK